MITQPEHLGWVQRIMAEKASYYRLQSIRQANLSSNPGFVEQKPKEEL